MTVELILNLDGPRRDADRHPQISILITTTLRTVRQLSLSPAGLPFRSDTSRRRCFPSSANCRPVLLARASPTMSNCRTLQYVCHPAYGPGQYGPFQPDPRAIHVSGNPPARCRINDRHPTEGGPFRPVRSRNFAKTPSISNRTIPPRLWR